jgi:hypothetical protein
MTKKPGKKALMRQKENFKPADMAKLDRKGHNEALTRFFQALGEDEIVQALHHSADPRVVQLLQYLFDPKYADEGFTKLCKECNLHLGDIVDVFRRYKLDLGIAAMSRRAPKIMDDTAKDAESQKAVCMACQGTGEVIDPRSDMDDPKLIICPNCVGEGTFRVPGHDKSRELFYKTMGLTKSTPMVAQQFNITSAKVPTIEDFVTEEQKSQK